MFITERILIKHKWLSQRNGIPNIQEKFCQIFDLEARTEALFYAVNELHRAMYCKLNLELSNLLISHNFLQQMVIVFFSRNKVPQKYLQRI